MGGCGKDKVDKEEDRTVFQTPFLGQWKEIAQGNENYPELVPEDVTLEFRADWTYTQTFSEFSETNVRNAHYSVDEAFIYYIYGGGSPGHTWKYSFYEDKLRLDYKDGPIENAAHTPHFYIYKRTRSMNEEEMKEFQKPFLGQWQEVARGNKKYPELPPKDVTLEYYPSWTLTRTYKNPPEYIDPVEYIAYSVDQEFVYHSYMSDPEDSWKYSFYEDTLRLDYKDGALAPYEPFYIYKRIIGGKEELTEFQKPFLGQWQEIARGNENYPELTPEDVSLEFRADWTYTQAFSETNVRNAHYSVDGAFLRYIYGGGSPGHTWTYSFYEDKLRLDYKDGPIEDAAHTPHFYIYKRIK
jgi:hypothetical protein